MKKKIFAYIFISILCCCNIADNSGKDGVDAIRDKTDVIKDSNIDGDRLLNSNDFRVDVYESDELSVAYFYDKGLLKKEIQYDVKTKTEESIVEYYYKENRELEKLEVTKGEEYGFLRHWEKSNLIIRYKLLKLKNVLLPFAGDVIADEIRDLSNILNEMEEQGFKSETKLVKNQKIVKFNNINKKISFIDHLRAINFPSYTSEFIKENDVVKNYELTLVDEYPTKEIYQTKRGKLIREYLYEDKKILKVLNTFTSNGKPVILERRFEYRELK